MKPVQVIRTHRSAWAKAWDFLASWLKEPEVYVSLTMAACAGCYFLMFGG